MKAQKLITALVIASLPGFVGAYFTSSQINGWYKLLITPSIAPPDWVFGPVWTILYILIGISLYLVLKKGGNKKEYVFALQVFTAQLINNALWSVIFFGLQRPLAAFVQILALWVLILLNILAFYKISRRAAWLLIPYLLWVSFAAYLNYAIVVLN